MTKNPTRKYFEKLKKQLDQKRDVEEEQCYLEKLKKATGSKKRCGRIRVLIKRGEITKENL